MDRITMIKGLSALCLVLAGAMPARAATVVTYTNSTPIPIRTDTNFSIVTDNILSLSGMTRAEVTLHGVNMLERSDQIDVYLQAPTSVRVMLLSDAGGAGSISNSTLTFSNTAASAVSRTQAPATGSYRPTNYAEVGNTLDIFPFPVEIFDSASTDLTRFNNNNLTPTSGQWKLFVIADGLQSPGSSSSISGGWTLKLTIPSDFTVTKTADTNDGTCDDDCSLREAIAAAGDGDLVQFASPRFDTPAVITLDPQLGPIPLTKGITIAGRGADKLRISGGYQTAIFDGSASTGVGDLVIKDLTLREASGFAVLTSPPLNLTLKNVAVEDNVATAGGFVPSPITVFGGSPLFDRCTFARNASSTLAGAIAYAGAPGGALTLVDSTISSNRSGNSSGALFVQSGGAGLVTVNISSSTIANNESPSIGAITASAVNSVDAKVEVRLRDSIVADNAGPNFGPDPANTGTVAFISEGYNLSDDPTNAVLNATTDQFNTDPKLAPLANWGGALQTHALMAGSPAIDKGRAPSTTTKDARGLPRVTDVAGIGSPSSGDTSDIGPVEMKPLFVLNADDSGAGSLRQALLDAEANTSDANDILFDPTFFATPRVVNLATRLPDITASLALVGPGAKQVTVQPLTGGEFRVFTCGAPMQQRGTAGEATLPQVTAADPTQAQVALGSLTIANGAPPPEDLGGYGGNIYCISRFVLSDAVVKDGATGDPSASGGGLYLGGSSTIQRSAITNNTSSGAAAIESVSLLPLDLVMVDTTVSGNTSGTGIAWQFGTGGATPAYARVERSTVVGGSLQMVGTTAMRATLRNVASTGALAAAPTYAVSQGYNLFGGTTPAGFKQSTDRDLANPQLGPLGDHGGPVPNHLPNAGSPLIDAGGYAGYPRDVNGFGRPLDLASYTNAIDGDGSDIGAVEFQNPNALFADGFE